MVLAQSQKVKHLISISRGESVSTLSSFGKVHTDRSTCYHFVVIRTVHSVMPVRSLRLRVSRRFGIS
jgi:hypothetical protein